MANIYEVARQAGVSIATVSRVQRGGSGVADETRQRVLATISRLRYRPSNLARSLAEGRRDALGIVFPDLSGPYYAGVILGFEAQVAASGQSVLILAAHRRDVEDQVLDLAERVDGLVLMGRTVADATVARLRDEGVPTVLLARPAVPGVGAVRSENSAAAVALTEHLIGHGARRITFLGDVRSSADAAERWRGFVRAHRNAGLPEPAAPAPSAMREQEGYAAACKALDRPDPPDALFCANDEIALGAIAAAQSTGRSIPQQLRVTGWDDIPVARFASPPLTTVRQPLHELGRRAATVLQSAIRADGQPPERVVLPTQLVIRSSCGCRPDASPGGVN